MTQLILRASILKVFFVNYILRIFPETEIYIHEMASRGTSSLSIPS